MLWAACCLAFFGFMRSGELTTSATQASTQEPPLQRSDISVDSHVNPQVLVVWLRHSKADPFGAGVCIYLGRTGSVLCPVTSMLGYLAMRSSAPGPLFQYADGSPLSRTHLVTQLREALSQAGIDTSNYSGHSFRIGAASAAAQAGYSDSLIQTLGRWKSDAFRLYLRTPKEDLVAATRRLANPQGNRH